MDEFMDRFGIWVSPSEVKSSSSSSSMLGGLGSGELGARLEPEGLGPICARGIPSWLRRLNGSGSSNSEIFLDCCWGCCWHMWKIKKVRNEKLKKLRIII